MQPVTSEGEPIGDPLRIDVEANRIVHRGYNADRRMVLFIQISRWDLSYGFYDELGATMRSDGRRFQSGRCTLSQRRF
jgi:hypothetical protein